MPAQPSFVHERARLGGRALAVERRAAQPAAAARIVDDRDALVRDALADLVREEAAALEHVVRGEERGDRAEQAHRHPRVEHDGQLLCGEGLRAELLDRAFRGALADLPRVEVGWPPCALAVISDLPLATQRRDRTGRRAAQGLAIR